MRPGRSLPTVAVPREPRALDSWLAAQESRLDDIVPGTEKQIVWYADPGVRQPLALVYLHGFSATHREMAPLAENLAAALNANLFLQRMRGHGRGGPAMAEAHIDDWRRDALEALAIGRVIGERVVVIGTSTGGSLALWLAAAAPEPADATVLLAPNLGPQNRAATIARLPWGAQIMRAVAGPERSWEPANAGQARYWTHRYPIAAVIPMMEAVTLAREVDVRAVRSPILVMYSPEDPVVDPARIATAFADLADTPHRAITITPSAAVDQHVFAGDILSPTGTAVVFDAVYEFVRETVHPMPRR
jgi:esterase/lipase